MSIARELGLETVNPLDIIAARWPDWVETQPGLRAVKVPAELQTWLERARGANATPATYAEIDAVLRGLAILAASDGGDDPDAAMVLAWVMLPAACAVARRNQRREPHLIDQIVAARLWVEVRSFPWRTRHGSVAANIARDLQRAVVEDMNALTNGPHTFATDPSDFDTHPGRTDHDDAATELIELLDEAIECGVIDWGQRALLLSIVEASEAAPAGRTARAGVAGLLTAPVEQQVAATYQVSGRHLRRHASACVGALARFKGGKR